MIKALLPSKQVLCQKVAGEAVLLDLGSEQYFGLDEVGVRIWDLLVDQANLEEIEKTLISEYDADPKVIARDLRDLVQKLMDAGLVIANEVSADKTP
jgi:hypothetical protein